jgi:hypothetical protein
MAILTALFLTMWLAVPSAAASRSGSPAIIGSGGGIEWTGIIGVVLIVLGVAVAVLVDAPRRILQRIRLRKGRSTRRLRR